MSESNENAPPSNSGPNPARNSSSHSDDTIVPETEEADMPKPKSGSADRASPKNEESVNKPENVLNNNSSSTIAATDDEVDMVERAPVSPESGSKKSDESVNSTSTILVPAKDDEEEMEVDKPQPPPMEEPPKKRAKLSTPPPPPICNRCNTSANENDVAMCGHGSHVSCLEKSIRENNVCSLCGNELKQKS